MDAGALAALEKLMGSWEALPESEWIPARIEELLRHQSDQEGIKAGALIHLCRLFLTGGTASPGIFDLIAAMSKAGALRRLRRGLKEARSLLNI
jgi:glutamyl-tRNA synthetase